MSKFHCSKCNFTTMRKYNLSRHMLSHTNDTEKERDWTICKFCDKKFSTIGNCRRHMVSCVESEQNAPKVVIGASKVVIGASKVVIEPSKVVIEPPKLVIDEQKQQFPCPTCYKSYSRQQYLQDHLPKCKRVSCATDCEKCHKHFSCFSNLAKHRKICKVQIVSSPCLQQNTEQATDFQKQALVMSFICLTGFVEFLKKYNESCQ